MTTVEQSCLVEATPVGGWPFPDLLGFCIHDLSMSPV